MYETPDISRLLERQLRAWELAAAQRLAHPEDRPEIHVCDFVTISRTVGADGWRIASLLGERLGWPVFNRELLSHMAADDGVRARIYEQIDERAISLIEGFVRWVLGGELRQDDYFHRLTQTVVALAQRSPAIFLGRGTDLILPHERGLRVMIDAPLEYRVQNFMQQRSVDERTARSEIQRIEHERIDFFKHHFRRDWRDHLRFDLVCNASRLRPGQIVEILVAALRQRGVVV